MSNNLDLISARAAYRLLGVSWGRDSEKRLAKYGIPVVARTGGARGYVFVNRGDVEAARMKLDAEKRAAEKRAEEQKAKKAAQAAAKKEGLFRQKSNFKIDNPDGYTEHNKPYKLINGVKVIVARDGKPFPITEARRENLRKMQALNAARKAKGALFHKGKEVVPVSRFKEIEDTVIRLMVQVDELQKEITALKGKAA